MLGCPNDNERQSPIRKHFVNTHFFTQSISLVQPRNAEEWIASANNDEPLLLKRHQSETTNSFRLLNFTVKTLYISKLKNLFIIKKKFELEFSFLNFASEFPAPTPSILNRIFHILMVFAQQNFIKIHM